MIRVHAGATPDLSNVLPGALDRRFVWMEVGAARVRGIPIVGLVNLMSIKELLADKDLPCCLTQGKLVDTNDHAAYQALLEETRIRAEIVGLSQAGE